MSKMNNIVQVVIGDWANDGHGRTEARVIVSNRDVSEVEKAYQKGVSIVGLDLSNEVACDFEDSSISAESMSKLIARGFKLDFERDEVYWETDPEVDDPAADPREEFELRLQAGKSFGIDTDVFFKMYMFIANLGDPELKFKDVEQKFGDLTIGGYGFFAS